MVNNYIKSPLNFQGGKHKILPQILPLFPKKIKTFVDMFCGGFNVGINVKAEKHIAIDICKPVIDLLKNMHDSKDAYRKISKVLSEYDLSDDNKVEYYHLKNDYNASKTKPWEMFYLLIAHSFSNQIRFNRQGNFNMPFGERTFNVKLRMKFQIFLQELVKKDIIFVPKEYYDFNYDILGKDDFVYIDPPYLISTATYNENGGWTDKHETELLIMLDGLNKKGIRFALSNVTHHKDKTNELLTEFAKDYTTHEITNTYQSCNYQSKKAKIPTREVLITNY